LAGIYWEMTLHAMDDWQLLQAYANDRSEAAFAELVRLHLDWVYSVALRHVGDPLLAQDVVQSVFVLLARKARDLRPGTILGGWLFRTTCHVSAHARRTEYRRKSRETIACTMMHDSPSTDSDEILWQQLVPYLDLAVAALSEADRSAILLRFYEKAPMLKVAERLGVSEEAAKKRVSRAVERMRQFLAQRGVKPGAVVLVAVLTEKMVQAAPAGLAGMVVKVSLAAASGSASLMLPQLARQTLSAWHWTKVKLAAGLAVSSLALILVVATSGGWLARHTGLTSIAVSSARAPDVGTEAQFQEAKAHSARTVNPTIRALPKIGAIAGVVVDEAQRPIAGAKVWGGFGQVPFAQDITDPSGQFALDKIDQPALVTVAADGFAADQQEFNPTNLPGPLVFHLSPVPQLKVRVVDESGLGAPGVGLFLYHWWGRAGTLGQDAPGQANQTDADGLLQWLCPPKGELELQFGKPDYRYSRTNKFAADGQEHVIVLHPAGTVTGSVTDAETGAPVDRFKFTMGHSQPWLPSDPEPMWDFRSKTGSNGVYKTTIEEEQVPFLRIEADGYETVETEIHLTNGVEAVRDFQLSRASAANSIRGTVLLPDGSPAAGVEVALCTTTVGVMLKGTAFKPGAFGNINQSRQDDYRRRTDERGSFSFDSKPGAHTVVAVGPAGLGQARCFDFSKALEIRLHAWGRIEGSVRTRDGQGVLPPLSLALTSAL
jgi:RNA polymerase sigma factor (sigma-70 family)